MIHKGLTPKALMPLLVALLAHAAGAQAPVSPDPSGVLESRAQLEAEARTAEQQNRTSEAWLLRTRLQRGDFQEGDRIVVTLLGSVSGSDTISVRAGKLLPLPKMGDVPLEGVLRSELSSRISSHLAKFLRDSSVSAIPLVRLAVLGQVQRPGFYYTAADVLLSDMLMKAGGPAPAADLSKTSIRRGGETIWNAQDTRTAMSDGLSIERLHLRAGDEIYVAEQKHTNWMGFAQIGISILGLAFALTRL